MPEPKRPLKVFLCHAHADRDAVRALYTRLKREGVDVWLDKEKLLPGANWEYEIRNAVRESDVVVVCLSKQFNQAGFRQKEVRIALDTALEKTEGEIFIIPARLEECDNLESLQKWHWVDLFEKDGFQRLILALRIRAARIGATLRIRKGGGTPTPRQKNNHLETKTSAEQKSTGELEKRKSAVVPVEQKAVERTAREKAERDAIEKAHLESEELARQKNAKEDHETVERFEQERIAREKNEADERVKREQKDKELREKAKHGIVKKKIETPKSFNKNFIAIISFFVAIIGFFVIALTSILGLPSLIEKLGEPTLTVTNTASLKTFTPISGTETRTTNPTATMPATLEAMPTGVFYTPTAKSFSCYIVFHSFRSGNLDIFRMDRPEGTTNFKIYNLSNSEATDSRPSISPNRRWIVFQSNRDGNLELYLTDSEGKSQTRLTNTSADNINAMFGPDNKSIIYQSNRNGNWDIFLLNKDTGEELQLTDDAGDDVNPFYSPEANWITFQSNRTEAWNVYVYDISTGTEYQVTSFSTDVLFPSWSPNGEQLAFFINTAGTWDLYVSDIQGKSFKQISIGGDAGNASWSPEGNRIAYQVTVGDNTDVFTYDLKTNEEFQLTNFGGVDSAPSWNCTGTEVTFTSTRSGNPDIYSIAWQGGQPPLQLTNNLATDKWSLFLLKEVGSRGY